MHSHLSLRSHDPAAAHIYSQSHFHSYLNLLHRTCNSDTFLFIAYSLAKPIQLHFTLTTSHKKKIHIHIRNSLGNCKL